MEHWSGKACCHIISFLLFHVRWSCASTSTHSGLAIRSSRTFVANAPTQPRRHRRPSWGRNDFPQVGTLLRLRRMRIPCMFPVVEAHAIQNSHRRASEEEVDPRQKRGASAFTARLSGQLRVPAGQSLRLQRVCAWGLGSGGLELARPREKRPSPFSYDRKINRPSAPFPLVPRRCSATMHSAADTRASMAGAEGCRPRSNAQGHSDLLIAVELPCQTSDHHKLPDSPSNQQHHPTHQVIPHTQVSVSPPRL
jgi:hypothetical protein